MTSSSGSRAGLAAESLDLQAGPDEEAAATASVALAAPSTFAAGASRVQVEFTTCMPAQHGTAKFPKAFTFLPLSVQLGRMPSHLHIASGCNDMGPKRVSSRFWRFNLRFEPHSYAIWWLRVAVLVAPRVLDRVGD